MSRAAVMFLACGLAVGASWASRASASALTEQGTSVGESPLFTQALAVAEESTPQAKPARPATPTPPAQPVPPVPPAAPGAPATAVPPPPPPAPPAQPVPLALPAPPMPPRKMVNVQLEFTITDQTAGAAPDKKIVTMIAADGSWGRVRASAATRDPLRGGGLTPVSLNVDARPSIVGNDKIQVELTIEYRPIVAITPGEPPKVDSTNLNQSLSVILQNGKPMVISQAADPVTDRKILVEAKATVLK